MFDDIERRDVEIIPGDHFSLRQRLRDKNRAIIDLTGATADGDIKRGGVVIAAFDTVIADPASGVIEWFLEASDTAPITAESEPAYYRVRVIWPGTPTRPQTLVWGEAKIRPW